jgi:hypothetical protein
MIENPKWLLYGWIILAVAGFVLIIVRTIQFGWFQGNDYVLWLLFAIAAIMVFIRK